LWPALTVQRTKRLSLATCWTIRRRTDMTHDYNVPAIIF
jgi:hypothetical protein